MEGNGKPRRLESWKAIAQYLGRDVTTAIRWEREKGLPVHRQTEGKRQVVFAYSTEIEHWRLHGSASATVEVERNDGAYHNHGASPANPSLVETRVVAAPINASRSRFFIGRKVALIAVLLALLAGFAALYVRASFKRKVASANRSDVLTFSFPGSILQFQKSVIPLHGRGDMQTADLNHDGALDLVIGSFPANGVQVLLGKGDGTFAPIQVYQGCPASHGPDIADLDGDGELDIVAPCYDDESLAIWWGGEGGSFQAIPSREPVGRKPLYAKIADLNNDGLPDIVVDSTGGTVITVLINQGNRSFVRHDYEVGFPSRRIAIFDLNGDGKLDILSGCMGESCQVTRMLQGNGDGSFRVEPFPSFGEFVVSVSPLHNPGGQARELVVSARDVRAGDWKLMLITGPEPIDSKTRLLKRASSPIHIMPVDFDGDGEDELAVVCAWTGQLTLLKRTSEGSYIESNAHEIGRSAFYFATGDFNGDGRTDLVLSSWDDNGPNLSVLLQTASAATPQQ